MSEKQVSALQGVVLAVLAALVAYGVVDPGVSDTVTGILVTVLTAVAAFAVKRPRDHE